MIQKQKNRIAIAQCNFMVGDIAGNCKKITDYYHKAVTQGAQLVVFSEMAITGYPPEDLVLRPAFRQHAMDAVEKLAFDTKNSAALVVGGIWQEKGILYNAAFLLENGEIAHTQYKHNLPNYGVFDEKRVFAAGGLPEPVMWRGRKLGILICEDMWTEGAARHHARLGAELLLVINASPYQKGKQQVRFKTARARVVETGLPLVYVNQIGGQDELVFDGNSFIMDATGKIQAQLPGFTEELVTDIATYTSENRNEGEISAVYAALKLALKDYVEKNRFKGVLLGLSGGIDSALVAAVAVDALGAKQVRAVMLPSPYTSCESLEDAAECAGLLGMELSEIAITPAMQAMEKMLAEIFVNLPPDITEENIQSRLRGNILMAMSNKLGLMLLTTGNKSEMAVGYATLYGDMCGGYNLLKDIYKTEVYDLVEWRNSIKRVIPENIITKPPSAELRPGQKDQDSLPPYEVLDAILEKLVEQEMGTSEIITSGYESGDVEKVANLLAKAEYKRRQAAPGVKITAMSFGRDRRYPLSNGYNFG